MIAEMKKKPERKVRYRAFTQDDVVNVRRAIEKRLAEAQAVYKDMAQSGIHAVEIDGAGALDRGLGELDTWVDLMTAAVVLEKRRRQRNGGF